MALIKLRRRSPVDGLSLASKALKVATNPAALAEIAPGERQQIDQIAKAVKIGASWSKPGANSGTIAQWARARPVSAEVVARQAAASLGPMANNVTPIDIETAMRQQGLDWVQPFAPGEPLTPFWGYNRRPRERNYDAGRNIGTQTRPNRIPFETLRHLIQSYDVAQICYRHAIQDLRSMRIRFEVMDGYEENAVKEIAAAKEFWRRPDKKLDPTTGKIIPGTGNTLRNWLCKHATDVWRFDCGTMYRHRDRAGRLISLPVADGTLFAPLLDYFGDNPTGEAPAFQQFVQGIPWDWLRWSDLIYEPMWPHTEDPYGIAPIETILVNANTDIRLQAYFLQFFTTGTVPEAFAIAPEDQSGPDDLADWQEEYNDWTYGDQSERWGLRWLPHGTELEFYKPQQFDPDVAEYVMRRTVASFMMVPHDLGFTADVNRSTADTQMDTQFRINSLPHVAYYEDILDSVTQEDLGLPVQMRFDTGREKEDRLMEAQAHNFYVGMGAESPDEVRDKVLGYPVNPEEKVPRFFDSQRLGPIPIAYLLATAGDVDPLTGAPRPGTVERRDIVLPGTTGPDPVDTSENPGTQYGRAAQHDAEQGKGVGGARPKGPSAPAPVPPLVQASVQPSGSKPAATNAPNPRRSAGVSSARRTDQGTASRRTLKEATAGIGIGTGIAGVAVEDEDDEEARKDLARWRSQSRSRVAKGKAPRAFMDSCIPEAAYKAVWEALEGAQTRREVDVAFAKAEEPDVAGVALVAADTGRVLMVQRGNKDDGDGARFEFPTGHLDAGESACEAAVREWGEETGSEFPKDAEQVGTWTSEDGEFQGFVYRTAHEADVELDAPDGHEISAVSWFDLDDLDDGDVRDKVRENLDRSEPIMERAEKAGGRPKATEASKPRPGPGGHREEQIVQYHAPKVQQALTQQLNPTQVATTFARLSGAPVASTAGVSGVAGAATGAAATAAASAYTAGSVIAGFVATLHVAVTALEVAILAMWADSWLAGAKDGRDSLDQVKVWVPETDALDRAVESVDWERWTPGSPPKASDLPGFDDVRQQIGELITGISETTRDQIARAVEQFVAGRVAPVPWSPSDVTELARQLEVMLNDAARAMLIARTEVNRAMTDSAINLFKRAGIAMFDLVPHPTACAICKGIAAHNPHPVGDVSSTPPIHVQCRCSVSPAH